MCKETGEEPKQKPKGKPQAKEQQPAGPLAENNDPNTVETKAPEEPHEPEHNNEEAPAEQTCDGNSPAAEPTNPSEPVADVEPAKEAEQTCDGNSPAAEPTNPSEPVADVEPAKEAEQTEIPIEEPPAEQQGEDKEVSLSNLARIPENLEPNVKDHVTEDGLTYYTDSSAATSYYYSQESSS